MMEGSGQLVSTIRAVASHRSPKRFEFGGVVRMGLAESFFDLGGEFVGEGVEALG